MRIRLDQTAATSSLLDVLYGVIRIWRFTGLQPATEIARELSSRVQTLQKKKNK